MTPIKKTSTGLTPAKYRNISMAYGGDAATKSEIVPLPKVDSYKPYRYGRAGDRNPLVDLSGKGHQYGRRSSRSKSRERERKKKLSPAKLRRYEMKKSAKIKQRLDSRPAFNLLQKENDYEDRLTQEEIEWRRYQRTYSKNNILMNNDNDTINSSTSYDSDFLVSKHRHQKPKDSKSGPPTPLSPLSPISPVVPLPPRSPQPHTHDTLSLLNGEQTLENLCNLKSKKLDINDEQFERKDDIDQIKIKHNETEMPQENIMRNYSRMTNEVVSAKIVQNQRKEYKKNPESFNNSHEVYNDFKKDLEHFKLRFEELESAMNGTDSRQDRDFSFGSSNQNQEGSENSPNIASDSLDKADAENDGSIASFYPTKQKFSASTETNEMSLISDDHQVLDRSYHTKTDIDDYLNFLSLGGNFETLSSDTCHKNMGSSNTWGTPYFQCGNDISRSSFLPGSSEEKMDLLSEMVIEHEKQEYEKIPDRSTYLITTPEKDSSINNEKNDWSFTDNYFPLKSKQSSEALPVLHTRIEHQHSHEVENNNCEYFNNCLHLTAQTLKVIATPQ